MDPAAHTVWHDPNLSRIVVGFVEELPDLNALMRACRAMAVAGTSHPYWGRLRDLVERMVDLSGSDSEKRVSVIDPMPVYGEDWRFCSTKLMGNVVVSEDSTCFGLYKHGRPYMVPSSFMMWAITKRWRCMHGDRGVSHLRNMARKNRMSWPPLWVGYVWTPENEAMRETSLEDMVEGRTHTPRWGFTVYGVCSHHTCGYTHKRIGWNCIRPIAIRDVWWEFVSMRYPSYRRSLDGRLSGGR